jgi:aspartyl-tRNA(Asn)/glutamyl-tRNA(Gln) amidotransferase subunit B
MLSKEAREQYVVTIGIECHVQLKTQTKLFTAIHNDARGADPNTLISHVDMGLPGSLPVLNKHAVELAAITAFALNTTPAPYSKFDRKHYFYPDLPLGYQITQFDQPIIIGGHIETTVNGKPHTVQITRAHLEADAGKSTHPSGTNYSLVDLNRVGTPLLEIVSEPDMHSSAEARAYAHELFLIVKYAGVSDADLFHGNMRFDVNVSVSKNTELGTRTETKNLNSFRSVEKAAEYEINRQIELLEKGKSVVQETRGWDDAKQKTTSQRGKEQAHDYRYMPDPDLPPVVLSNEFIANAQSKLPTMPSAWRKKLVTLGLDASQTAILVEAEVTDNHVSYLSMLEQSLDNGLYAKQLANWFVNIEIPERGKEHANLAIKDEDRKSMYANVYKLLCDKKLSSSNAKLLIIELLSHQTQPSDIEAYAEEKELIQVSDETEVEAIVADVLKSHEQAALDVKNGEMKAIGFLVGQVMKQSRGKANPALAQELIKKQLNV